jgi:Trypsin
MRTRRKVVTKRLLGVLAALVALPVFGVGSATAITGGEPDGDAHPYVGVMIAYDAGGDPLWECSGTLLSSTVFLTAGHCILSTDGVQAHQVGIWFESGPIPIDPSYKNHSCSGVHGFPCAGFSAVSSTLSTLPGYSPDAFVTHDLGVVQLDADQAVALPRYGVLPGHANELDSLKTQRGRHDQTFTTVGYGAQQSFPGAASRKNVGIPERMVATPKLVQIGGGGAGDSGLVLSDNSSTGGMCFGDSGGPTLLGSSDEVVAVSSAVENDRCAGTSLAFRVDQPTILDWLETGFGLQTTS